MRETKEKGKGERKEKVANKLKCPKEKKENHIRDCERKAPVLQVTWARRETGASVRPQGDHAGHILNSLSAQGLRLPALPASLARAVLKEVH